MIENASLGVVRHKHNPDTASGFTISRVINALGRISNVVFVVLRSCDSSLKRRESKMD